METSDKYPYPIKETYQIEKLTLSELEEITGEKSFMNLFDTLLKDHSSVLTSGDFKLDLLKVDGRYIIEGNLAQIKARCFNEIIESGFLPFKNDIFYTLQNAMSNDADRYYPVRYQSELHDQIMHIRSSEYYSRIEALVLKENNA